MTVFTLLILQMPREMCQCKCAFISHSSVMKIYLPFSFSCTLPASSCRCSIKLLNKEFSLLLHPYLFSLFSPWILSLQSANNSSLKRSLLPLSNPISSVVLHTVSAEHTIWQNNMMMQYIGKLVFFFITLKFTCYNTTTSIDKLGNSTLQEASE